MRRSMDPELDQLMVFAVLQLLRYPDSASVENKPHFTFMVRGNRGCPPGP
jgi:hypothetical protein